MIKLKGFTLVELIVVIAIIAVLAGGVLTVVDPAARRQRARDSVRKSDLAVMSSALENYYADNNSYPNTSSIECLYQVLNGSSACAGGTSTKAYLKTQPRDPLSSQNYCYSVSGTQNYNLCATLEKDATELNGAQNCFAAASGDYYCTTNPF